MTRLPTITCPGCNQTITSRDAVASIKRPLSYADCLRQCARCGFGFSNANERSADKVTILLRMPFAGIPEEVTAGWQEVCEQALNEKNRKSKQARMASLNSEDHVTWIVFRYLQLHHSLRASLVGLGLTWLDTAAVEPTVLLWGVPLPLNDPKGKDIHSRLRTVLTKLGENCEYLSEPDVILDFGRIGVIFIVVKLKSINPTQEANERWDKYFSPSDSSTQPFCDLQAIRRTGLYELMRNWRIAWDLADERPFALVNLGPEQIFSDKTAATKLQEFQNALSQSFSRRFISLTWNQLLESVPNQEEWFRIYTKRRIPTA